MISVCYAKIDKIFRFDLEKMKKLVSCDFFSLFLKKNTLGD